MKFAGSALEARNEFRNVRSKNTYLRTCSVDEFDTLVKMHQESVDQGTAGYSKITAKKYDGDRVRFERKKPRWEVFEDKVWEMFYHLKTPLMPVGKIVVEYDDERTKQIDGLFSDDEYVYLVECKWKRKKDKLDQDPGSVVHDVLEWRGIWERMVGRLSEYEQFQGKKFVFILATTGIKWTKSLRQECDGFAELVDRSMIDEIMGLTKLIGPSARTNLLQTLFMNRPLPREPRLFPCIRSSVGGSNTYYFFARPSEMVDLCYVPRRSPGNKRLGLGTSYQRMLKPKKVNQIRDYLEDESNFFPNSIIATTNKVGFTPTDDRGEQGHLHLPNHYGSVRVIDGQHRLFGSIKSKREKPLAFCVVEGLSGLDQSKLFTEINQKQTIVPAELLWDLYGEGVNLATDINDHDRSDIKMAKNYIVSNIWKGLNRKPSHPLCGRIIVPSQTEKDKERCHISFGQICKFLAKNQRLWSQGYLKGVGDWESAMKFSRLRVDYFFRYLHEYMEDEFDRPMNGRNNENWLLSNYSFEALISLFTHACLFWGGVYPEKWLKSNVNTEKGNFRELIKKFCEMLSRALVDERHGFYNEAGQRDIRKAGNSAQRNEYMKDVVRFIRNDNKSYSEHFAPKLDIDGDQEGDRPSAEVSRRVEEMEEAYAGLIYETLVDEFGEGIEWFNRVPRDVQAGIREQIEYKTMQLRQFHKEPDLEWLMQTNTGQLLKIVQHRSMVVPWKQAIGGVAPDLFSSTWKHGFEVLRNMKAHNDPYPSPHMKQMVLGALGMLEGWYSVAMDKDETPPEIELIGDPEIIISMGDDYTDPGATAADDVDGNITDRIATKGEDFDTNVGGVHIISYNVSDSAGNDAIEIQRTVTVEEVD